ncbi:hypothetical protein EON65_39235 [archaeon]|nr:MAG: hypothetical protein EON65_39235 [archaeon]
MGRIAKRCRDWFFSHTTIVITAKNLYRTIQNIYLPDLEPIRDTVMRVTIRWLIHLTAYPTVTHPVLSLDPTRVCLCSNSLDITEIRSQTRQI